MARIDDARAFLNDPTRVKIYTFEERKARALDRPQTDAEEREALRRWPRRGLTGDAAVRAVQQRLDFRDVQDRDPALELEKLARRYASTDYYRTLPSGWEHEHDLFRADLLLKKWKREGLVP